MHKDNTNNFIQQFFSPVLRLNHDVTWSILIMSLQPFWALNMSVALLSMESSQISPKYLNLCLKKKEGLTGLE